LTRTRLVRRLGLDGNSLRRRTDKVAACLAGLLLAIFLIGAPLLSVAAAHWAGGGGPQQAGRSPHQVLAVLLRAAPDTATCTGAGPGYCWVPAQWTTPDGKARVGRIPVSTGPPAGSTVRLSVNAAGTPIAPPPSPSTLAAREATAVVLTTCALGIAIWCLGRALRWMLDRRRLTAWETGWAAIGPQWTRCFRPRG